jgi:hypothetical protein
LIGTGNDIKCNKIMDWKMTLKLSENFFYSDSKEIALNHGKIISFTVPEKIVSVIEWKFDIVPVVSYYIIIGEFKLNADYTTICKFKNGIIQEG